MAWVRPDGHVLSSWYYEQCAYDSDLTSHSGCATASYSWSPFLELTSSSGKYCSKLRFYAYYRGSRGINKIDLDVYYDDEWHDVYEGSFLSKVWVEKSLSATKYVTKMRMRFFNQGSITTLSCVWEAAFYETTGIPVLTTNAATDVADGNATLNGDLIYQGGIAPTTRGFKYKEGIAGAEQDTSDSGYFAVGEYNKDLTGLDPTKKYYFRAYATNTEGTGYGEWKSFGEDTVVPTLTTSAATLIGAEQATLNGNITETGGEDPIERGFQWKIGATGDIETLRETGEFGVGAYTLDLEDLSPNIEYYFRAYATNEAGAGYGDWLSFTTDYSNPEVITHNATDELKNQVTGNGEIVSTGGQDCDERGFDYGLDKVNTSVKSESAGGYGVGLFDLDITGLTENTEYWYRAWAKYDLFNAVKRTTGSVYQYSPQFQIVGDKIYYVWNGDDSDSYGQIWTAVSDLDGSNLVITQRTTTAYNSYYPQLQVVGSKIYYVWEEHDGTRYQIFTAISNLDGSGWVATKQTTTAYNKEYAQLQVVGNTIYYVFEEIDTSSKWQVWVATSDLNGENFTATKKTTSAYTKHDIQLQVVGTVIYYVWVESDGSKNQIWVATMDTDGTDWAATKKTTSAYTKDEPQLQVVDTVIYYVWREWDGTYYQIWTATMTTAGADWSATKKTTTNYSKDDPQFQVVGTVIYYVWVEDDGSDDQIWIATMDTDGSDWAAVKKTTSAFTKEYPQLSVTSAGIYYIWDEADGSVTQIWTAFPFISYGEWVKFITAAPGSPGDKPSGYKNDVCSDQSGYTYILNRSFTDDGASYESYFVLSTDLSGKKTLHTNKRLLDIYSYFDNKGTGTAKVYVKRDTEPSWQYAGEVSLTGGEEVIIKHLPVDFLAKTYLIKFVFWNDFEFIGTIFEAVPIGDRPSGDE